MNERKHLLFDFDGVIVDTVAMIDVHAVRHWKTSLEEQKAWAEGNVYARPDGTVPEKLDAEQQRIADAFYRDYASDIPVRPVFDGMRQAIEMIADRYTLHVVSSTPTAIIKDYLVQSGLAERFALVHGLDVAISKSVKINRIVEEVRAPLRNFLMITDSLGDIREARHAGVEAIGVMWGIHERARLEKGSPWGICEIPAELPNAIDTYFAEV